MTGALGEPSAGGPVGVTGPPAVGLEAGALQRVAESEGVALRLIGSLAIAMACPGHQHLMPLLGRRPPLDIDFMGYSRDERRIATLFTRRGYELHPAVRHSREWGVKRLIYTHPDTSFKIDVFLDELVMAHTIDFAGRLEEREHTVPLADLLLSKLQIYRITENDLIDLIVLLGEREVGDRPEDIRLARVVSVLSNDWGFYYGTMVNLDKLDEAIERHRDVPPEVAWRVRARSRQLREAIDLAPKTRRWRLRARIGTRATWYEDVAEVEI